MIGQLPGGPRCPACGHGADGFAGDGRPGPGDGAVCAGCGELSIYAVNALTGRYSLVPPTAEQRVEFGLLPDEPGPETLPCGCIVDTVGDAFVMQPCRPDCPTFRYAVAESKRQGKPIRTIRDPEFER